MQEKGETITVPVLIGEPSIDTEYTDTGARIPSDITASKP
jgi:hypothetical protein